jgi:hypothetical protein
MDGFYNPMVDPMVTGRTITPTARSRSRLSIGVECIECVCGIII